MTIITKIIYKTSFLLMIAFLTITCISKKLVIDASQKRVDSKPIKEFLIGVDDAGDKSQSDKTVPFDLIAPMKELGVQFLVHNYNPQTTLQEQKLFVEKMGTLFDKNNLNFLLDVNISNNSVEFIDADGWSWFQGPNKTHRFNFKPEVLFKANQFKSFEGLLYDEPAHNQLNRNWIFVNGKKFDLPFLAETTGKSFDEADQLIYKNAKQLVDEIKNFHTPYVVAEHVFPVLFHNFARAGMTLSYKQLKESWAPLWAACAMGAALQYNSELWACLDLWFAGIPGNSPMYPGHSPEELKDNLIYSYWIGNDRVYVENLNYKGSLYKTDNEKIILNDYGKTFKWFTHKYLPQNKRDYTFREIKPEIAIIRFDDTDFGITGKNGFPDQLFGSKTLKSSTKTRNWMKIWNLVSHGVIPTPENGISWLSYPLGTPHKSFAPMNGVVVFDHTVEKKHLETLKLAFLAGLMISPETLVALEQLVGTNGLMVVTTPELAPITIREKYTGTGTQIINDGTTGGCWVVTDNFLDPIVKAKIKPLLGKENEMRYVFGNEEVIFKIGENDSLTLFRNKL